MALARREAVHGICCLAPLSSKMRCRSKCTNCTSACLCALVCRLHTEIVDFGAGHIQPALFQAPPKLLWGGGEGQIKLGAPPAFEYTELSTEAGKYRVATQLLTVGIVLIHGVPAVSGKV